MNGSRRSSFARANRAITLNDPLGQIPSTPRLSRPVFGRSALGDGRTLSRRSALAGRPTGRPRHKPVPDRSLCGHLRSSNGRPKPRSRLNKCTIRDRAKGQVLGSYGRGCDRHSRDYVLQSIIEFSRRGPAPSRWLDLRTIDVSRNRNVDSRVVSGPTSSGQRRTGRLGGQYGPGLSSRRRPALYALPILFVYQWDDELIARDAGLARSSMPSARTT